MLLAKHEVMHVGARSGDVARDYTEPTSVRGMFERIGSCDALIAMVGGDSLCRGYRDLAHDVFRFGFERKFLGQARLVRLGDDDFTGQASLPRK